jgi:hypothetical protein
MADDKPSLEEETDAPTDEKVSREPPPPEKPVSVASSRTEEPASESRSKGLLRDAIQKVMEEIEYHEREAKKHLQMAEALRIDLRDSFSFLQERGEKARPSTPLAQGRSAEAAGPDAGTPARDSAVPRQQRGRPRKKPGAGKGK